MSLYGAMITAVSGLNAQAKSLGHISDNVANSQTTGFKRVDTNFVNYLTLSTQRIHSPGSVVARPDYTNTLQGTVEQVENNLSLALAGQGFFAVSRADGEQLGLPTFDDQIYYTRAGDFTLDENGYLANGSGYYLRVWDMDAAGNVDRTSTRELRITDTLFNPVETSEITVSANLPADLPAGAPDPASEIQVYDTLGTLRTIRLEWARNALNEWTLNVIAPDDIADVNRGTIDIDFGDASVNTVPDGTIGTFHTPTGPGALTGTAFAPGGAANVSFTTDFGNGPQTIALKLGNFGSAAGVTQYAGTEYAERRLSQNGVPLGAFSSLAFRDSGDVVINYDNGQSRTVARVPVVTFNDPDRLQRQDGQGFTRTLESGDATFLDAASNGAGKLVVSALERSNVDIAAEFTKLIVAQRAYTANTKVVTASDEMLQDTLNMRR